MNELEFVKSERLRLREKYLKEVKDIWVEFEGEEAYKKYKSVDNKYRNRDKFLEAIESRFESCLQEVEFYKRGIQGKCI